MLKKTVNTVDFDGNQVTEDLYFNLTKAEMLELRNQHPNMFEKMYKNRKRLEEVVSKNEDLSKVDEEDLNDILTFIRVCILASYGERYVDPVTNKVMFRKNMIIAENFATSEAFSEIYFDICGDEKKAEEFFNAIMPKINVELPVPIPKQRKK